MSDFKHVLNYQAMDNMDRVAIVDDIYKVEYTYKDLMEYAQGFNVYNLNNKKVGILLDKSADYIAAIYSIVMSNNSFVPLDPQLPLDRLKFIVEDSQLDYILTNDNFKEHEILSIVEKPLLTLEKYTRTFKYIYNNESLMYTIYTSGTTGVPKGVEVSYAGILNVISQQIDLFELDRSNVYLFLSISFDASLSDIFCSLLSGSTLFIQENIKLDIPSFINYMNINKIDYIDIPPSFLKLINPEELTTLKSIVIGGEVADKETVINYSKQFKLINVYGPTEATICTSYSICDESWDIPLIGTPLKNVDYLVLDDLFNETKLDEEGELYIGGLQLATGYTNPKITDERFLMINQKRFYKSGDKVVKRLKGIEFIGRIDRQIKHNGQLICLEEIEQAINSLKTIENVSVVYKNKKIVAYYEGDVEVESIKKHIIKILPKYMVPHFYFNKKIPKTASGKNDSKSLGLNDLGFEDMACLFSTILDMEIPDLSLSFSELGADSINFIELQLALNKMNRVIDYNYLIKHNTIMDILNYKKEKVISKSTLINSIDINKDDNYNGNKMVINSNIAMVTGGNGFLGIHLLAEITKTYEITYCLIRSDSINDARLKVEKAASHYNKNLDYEKLIFIPITNLYDDYLGMSESNYFTLDSIISNIYHLAGNVNNILSFEDLYNDNVKSTINIVKFANSQFIKNVHNASTLSVYVSGSHSPNLLIGHNKLENDNNILYTGYAQSKWLSDYYIDKKNDLGNLINYRFGLLVPTLEQNTINNSFLTTLLKEMIDIENMPEDKQGLCFDFTPVDFAAQAMLMASLSPSESIYNISLNKKVYFNDLCILLNKKLCSVNEWFTINDDKISSQILTMLNNFKYENMNLFEMTDIDYIDISKIETEMFDNIDVNKYLTHYIDLLKK